MNERLYQLALIALASMVNCTFSGAQGLPGADGVDGAPDDQTVDAAPTPDAQNPDRDSDGVENLIDNCPDFPNPMQSNEDGDDYGNRCDVCPHVVDNDQTDSDNDGVGDSCDPQPGATNSWLYFNGFDQALIGGDWAGENGFNVSDGALHSVDNTDRYVLRNKTINHGNDVMVVSAIKFSNPSTDNANTFRYKYGGPIVRAGTLKKYNSCWVVHEFNSDLGNQPGYSFMEGSDSDNGNGVVMPFSATPTPLIADAEYTISATVHGSDYMCNFQTMGDALSLSHTTGANRAETAIGLVSSYVAFEAQYLLAISLQPPNSD